MRKQRRRSASRLCFHYIVSTIPLLPTSEISSFSPSSLVTQPDLCRTWLGTPKTIILLCDSYKYIFGCPAGRNETTHLDSKVFSYEPRSEKTGPRGFRAGPI